MQGYAVLCKPSMFAFILISNRIPCKSDRVQHHLQRLRLHQAKQSRPQAPQVHRKGWGANDHLRFTERARSARGGGLNPVASANLDYAGDGMSAAAAYIYRI